MPDLREPAPTIIIIGGGIIGVCTAYYLATLSPPAQPRPRILIVEQAQIACSASGKAGGFLACNWSEGTDIDPLVRASFDLHEQLAIKHDGARRWQYRKVDTYIVQLNMNGAINPHSKIADQEPLDWVRRELVEGIDQMGATDNTAQVSPLEFTESIFFEAQSRGVELKLGTVVDVVASTDSPHCSGEPVRRKYTIHLKDGELLFADKVVVACGAWSGAVQQWRVLKQRHDFSPPAIPILGLRAHSIVLRPRRQDLPPHCLFVEVSGTPYGGEDAIEVYPRTNGTVYICGEALEPEDTPPEDPRNSIVKPGACEQLLNIVFQMSDDIKGAEVLVEQACYLPISKTGIPCIGEVPGAPGFYLATGHSCWGILNAPGTGKAMAELILFGQAKCIDITPYRVGRFDVV